MEGVVQLEVAVDAGSGVRGQARSRLIHCTPHNQICIAHLISHSFRSLFTHTRTRPSSTHIPNINTDDEVPSRTSPRTHPYLRPLCSPDSNRSGGRKHHLSWMLYFTLGVMTFEKLAPVSESWDSNVKNAHHGVRLIP